MSWRDVAKEFGLNDRDISIGYCSMGACQRMAEEIVRLRYKLDLQRSDYRQFKQEIFSKLKRSEAKRAALRDGIEHIKKSCLCDRGTNGFDYGEVHPSLGKHPRIGARWTTPYESCISLLAADAKEDGL